jgi:hypothetical protein
MPSSYEQLAFANTIIRIAKDRECTHFEGVLWYCANTGLEIEVASTLVNSKLRDLIADDARKIHMLKD